MATIDLILIIGLITTLVGGITIFSISIYKSYQCDKESQVLVNSIIENLKGMKQNK